MQQIMMSWPNVPKWSQIPEYMEQAEFYYRNGGVTLDQVLSVTEVSFFALKTGVEDMLFSDMVEGTDILWFGEKLTTVDAQIEKCGNMLYGKENVAAAAKIMGTIFPEFKETWNKVMDMRKVLYEENSR